MVLAIFNLEDKSIGANKSLLVNFVSNASNMIEAIHD